MLSTKQRECRRKDEESRFNFRQDEEINRFTKTSRLYVVPTQTFVQWVSGIVLCSGYRALFCAVGIGHCFLMIKRPMCESSNSLPTSAKIMTECSNRSNPAYAFMMFNFQLYNISVATVQAHCFNFCHTMTRQHKYLLEAQKTFTT